MTGKLVNSTILDSVRIEVLGEGRALTVPCSIIIDVDDSLRRVVDAADGTMIVHRMSDETWSAECDHGRISGSGATPMQAIANMRKRSA